MNQELVDDGHGDAVQFVVINANYATSTVANLTNLFDHPVFQDTAQVGAWGLHGGGKDDIFIYDQGLLATFLPQGGAVSIVLSNATGYDNVKSAIEEAIAAP